MNRWYIRKWQMYGRRKHCPFNEMNTNVDSHAGHRREEFRKFHRYLIWLRPIALLIPILLVYLMFRFIGVKSITIFFAVVFTAKEIIHLLIMIRLEKRIIKPVEKLKDGVEQIAKGNYDVKIESKVFNEIGILIDEFNKMAEKLNENEKLKQIYEENRKALIANISHDLKTPITSINGYIEALIDGVITSPEKINSYLRIIESNMTYMNNLIDDLFLFSKLDMQKVEFKFEKIDIIPFITDTMEEFKFMLGEKGITLNFSNNICEVLVVNIDRKRIYQAIRNVIDNAVKYGDNENLVVDVTLFSENNSIIINIADNGPGISKDKLPYIFDRFYRVDTERTKDLMSTGLGLAISKEMLKAHGGSISVSSETGEGSTFTLMIPIAN